MSTENGVDENGNKKYKDVLIKMENVKEIKTESVKVEGDRNYDFEDLEGNRERGL